MSKESIVGAKAGSGDQPKPNIAPDSARSVTRLQQVIGLSEGEIKGFGVSDIKLDGTPLSALSTSIKCDYRFGSSNQTSIDGVDEVANEIGVGIELRSDREWTKAITNTTLDALGLRLRWSPLVTNHENGDRTGVRIVYKVYIAPANGSYALVLDGLIDDKTADSYERYHEFKLPQSNNGWMIRVVRETQNSDSSLITDKMYVQAYSEIIKSKFNYPFTSLIALEYDAQTFPNIAKVAVEAEGMIIKVPTNYDPIARTYSGIWNGLFKLAYTNNPAWIYYDLVTNARYGLGDKIKVNMVDKWALYKLAMYCDQMISDGYGGLEPRFTCNVYLQSKERAYDILNRLTGLFRAINFWSGTEIVVDADIPQDTSYLYTNANVIDGLFEYAGTPATERYSVAKVAWDNPLNAYSTEYEAVSYEHLIKELGFRVLELDAWGCTSRGQAIRAGRWALLAETDTITFKVGMDGYLALPGKVIEVQDEFYAGKSNGGRIKSIDATRKIITVDRDVSTISGDTLSINTNSGEVLKYDITSSAGKVITLSTTLSQDIDILSIWVINSSTLVTQKYRVMTVKYDDVGEFTISATAYDSNKYEEIDNNIVFDDPPTSLINPIAQDSVTDVQIESTNLVYQGLNNVNLTIKWVRAVNAVEYLVEFKKDNGTWLKLPTTGNSSITLDNVYAGAYLARVTAVSAFGLHSLSAYSVNTDVLGKLLPPSAPLNFRTSPAMFAVNVLWGFPANSKDVAFTRIQASALDPLNMPDLTHVIEVDRAYPETKLTVDGMRIGYPKWFRAKLVDKLGFESSFTEWVQGESNEDPASVIELISGHISEGTLDQILQGKIEAGVAGEALAGTALTAANAAADQAASALAASSSNVAALKAELDPQILALENGVTTLTTNYQSADAVIVGQLNAYKTSNDSAVASVLQKAESAVSTGATNSSAITAINGKITTLNGALSTKLDASVISGYYTKGQTDTKAAEIAAGKVEEFNTSLKVGGENLWSLDSAIPVKEQGGATVAYLDRNKEHFKVTATAFSASNANLTRHDSMLLSKSLDDVDKNAQYTLSFEIKAIKVGSGTLYSYFNGANIVTQIEVSTEWQRFEFTPSNKPLGTSAASTGHLFAFGLNTANGWVLNDWYEVRYIQMQKGTKATAFSKASLALQKALDANSTAIQNTNAEVTRVDGVATAANNATTALSGRVSTVEGSVATKADTTALNALTTRVTNAEGVNTAQGTSITNLNSSLATTNTNVTTAQTAANNAMTAAGAKGKVLFQSTVPVAADQLSQNLWIDTTSNANTPKRWNGTAWVVVTDKVATDAAAAAAAANTALTSKADASALTSLTTRVTNAEGVNTSQATALTNLSTTVGGHTTTINSQTTSINGVKGVHALKIDTNGVISGYGLVSELIDGVVKSQFGVNASTFFIGAPANNKKPFIVLTAPGTINGVTVPAGTYIDTAFIADATIGTAQIRDANITAAKIADAAITTAKISNAAITAAKIEDLAVTTAKIGDAAITAAKIGDLQVDTLKIKNNAVTVSIAGQGVNTLAIQCTGGKVRVDVGVIGTWMRANNADWYMSVRLKRNGTLLYQLNYQIGRTYYSDPSVLYYVDVATACPAYIDDPGVGTHTYTLELGHAGSGFSPFTQGATPGFSGTDYGNGYSSIALMETKK